MEVVVVHVPFDGQSRPPPFLFPLFLLFFFFFIFASVTLEGVRWQERFGYCSSGAFPVKARVCSPGRTAELFGTLLSK